MATHFKIPQKTVLVLGFFIAIIGLYVTYSQSFCYGFLNYDDQNFIVNNFLIHHLSFSNIYTIFKSPQQGHYQPLTQLFYAFEWHMFEEKTHFYRLINLMIHALNGGLIFKILKQLKCNEILCALSVLLFYFHPLQTESLVWISAQSTLTSSCFTLLSFFFYLRFLTLKNNRFYALSWLSFFLGCLFKSSSITLVLFLFLIEGYKLYTQERQALKIKWIAVIKRMLPFMLGGLFFGGMAIVSAQKFGSFQTDALQYVLIDRLLLVQYAWAHYLVSFLYPMQLNPVYGSPEIDLFKSIPVKVLGIVFCGCVLLGVMGLTRRISSIHKCLALGFYGASIFLVMQWVSIGEVFAADRYAYLSVAILSVMLFYFLSKGLSLSSNYVFFGGGLFIIGGIVLSINQQQIWKNNNTLYQAVIKKNPNHFFGYYGLGVTQMQNKAYGLAEKNLQKASEIRAFNPLVHNALGLLSNVKQDYQTGIKFFNKAIILNPRLWEAYVNKAKSLFLLGDKQGALDILNHVLALYPKYLPARINRVELYIDLKLFSLAQQEIKMLEKQKKYQSHVLRLKRMLKY